MMMWDVEDNGAWCLCDMDGSISASSIIYISEWGRIDNVQGGVTFAPRRSKNPVGPFEFSE